jgi:hypothetical protein
LTYDDANSAFILVAVPAAAQDSTVATASIANSAVTYAKIQNVTDQRLLGNFSGAAAAPSEYSISGAAVSGSAISFPNPPPASFSNLTILVAGNLSATVAADAVTMTDGSGNYVTKPLPSSTLGFSSSGAVNRLDTGAIAQNKWYAVYAIYNGTTVGTLASLSGTAPTMPSGYTYKARIGWLRTNATSAQLMGTSQIGKRVQYVVGLAQTSQLPTIDRGAVGTWDLNSPVLATASISSVVPTTATAIHVIAMNTYKWSSGSFANLIVAPSTAYSGSQNGPTGTNGMVFPIFTQNLNGQSQAAWLVIEGTNIAWAADNSKAIIVCGGWEDNL